MGDGTLGFIGLGNMGGPMATNLARSGRQLVVYDKAGTDGRAPAGTRPANGIAGIAASVETVMLSLPDGPVVSAVAREIAATQGRATKVVVDHSTIGVEAAKEVAAILGAAGIRFLDAPVSGGVSGAVAGSLAMMIGGDAELVAALDDAFAPMARNRFHAGPEAGQGQAMKLLNNFLSATAMAATSEAIAFGEQHGLDMALMLDVVKVSSGRNCAVDDKFPTRVLTGTYDAGFTVDLLAKDVRLYIEEVARAGTADTVGQVVHGILEAMRAAMPGADFTRIYPFTRDKKD